MHCKHAVVHSLVMFRLVQMFMRSWLNDLILSQEERSTWCAGTRTRLRRRGQILSRRREIKYSVIPSVPLLIPRCDISHDYNWLMWFQEIYVHILDLSETRKVWEFAENFKKKFKTLNVLVRKFDDCAGTVWSSCTSGSVGMTAANGDVIRLNLCRSIMQEPSWVRGTWTLKDSRRASLSTCSVREMNNRCNENVKIKMELLRNVCVVL